MRERRREARRCELRLLCEQEARIKQRVTEIVREADDEGDWQAGGCSSSAQWLAQLSSSDHRTAVRTRVRASALRSLPALDHALSTGALTLDQVAAAAEFATPASDAELARIAVGKAPSADRAGGAHDRPPTVGRRPGALQATRAEHDLDARAPRAHLQRAAAARAGHRLRAGHPEHRQGPARRRQAGRHDPRVAAVGCGRARHARPAARRRSDGEAQPDHPDRAHQRRRAAAARRRRPAQPRDRRAAHLRRPPPRHQAHGRDLVHSRVGRCASYPSSAHCTNAQPLPIPRLHRPPRTRSPPPHTGRAGRRDRARQPHPALPPPPQTAPRPPHPHQRHRQAARLPDQAGRAITTNQPHAPPHSPGENAGGSAGARPPCRAATNDQPTIRMQLPIEEGIPSPAARRAAATRGFSPSRRRIVAQQHDDTAPNRRSHREEYR